MFYGNPRIYNGDGLYNGGGASSSVDVDINGVVTTLVVPPYLVPVEYIDSSEFPGNLQIGLSGIKNGNQNFNLVVLKLLIDCVMNIK